MREQVPVIDLFAGPGGLAEGFASFQTKDGRPPFKICLAIEKDDDAHRTLEIRSFFRQFGRGFEPAAYFDFMRNIDTPFDERLHQLYSQFPAEADRAKREAWRAELGVEAPSHVSDRISGALQGSDTWVLIGGPPCQAYSVAGRSRNRGKKGYVPEHDQRQYLYVEYLQVIAEHAPSLFIMENVRGLLSATLREQRIFDQIVDDLASPAQALKREGRQLTSRKRAGQSVRYRIYSLVRQDTLFEGNVQNFLVKMEEHGVPQARHRVILVGVRDDLGTTKPATLPELSQVPTKRVLSGLPRLRAGLTHEPDTPRKWRTRLHEASQKRWFVSTGKAGDATYYELRSVLERLALPRCDRGAEYLEHDVGVLYQSEWYLDERVSGVCNHSSRAHTIKDLYRYLYASSYARAHGQSPRLSNFPRDLLPEHRNVSRALNGGMFSDRFRVQLSGRPATTVTSHIAKDGHYYIHYDPTQCRSLTVREAARLQTFPDNYFFSGPRTAQYVQVGNAVPPLLAQAIAGIVYKLLDAVGIIA